MKNNKVLVLILTITFSPFLIAAILTTDYFSQQLDQKQYGEFLTSEFYLPKLEAEVSDPISTSAGQWQLVISPAHINYDAISNKLNKIKTALGKRSDLVNVLSTTDINAKPLASENTVYIATPNGQLLLAYRNEQVGKPLFKDLSHLLRSNN
ncbi:MAG: hypothetical protein ACI978_000174 [Oleispira sp.]|jgi:hypothetical protein